MYHSDLYQWLSVQADALTTGNAQLDADNLAVFLTKARQEIRREFVDDLGYSVCRELANWLIYNETARDKYLITHLLPCHINSIISRYTKRAPSLLEEIEQCWEEAWHNCAKYYNRRAKVQNLPLAPLWSLASMTQTPTIETAHDYRQRYLTWKSSIEGGE